MDIDWGSIIQTVVTTIVVPEIADYVEKQHATGQVVTEAGISAELEARGTFQRARDEAWLAAHPLPQETGGEVPPAVTGDGGAGSGS